MAADTASSTRVFVTGLPQSLTSDQLASHFASQYNVTDAHVLPDRRIGFVGFSDNATAQQAVKYFNRSYIRMSKIAVDLAKPIQLNRGVDGQAVPQSQRPQQSRQGWQGKAVKSLHPEEQKKRKRDIDDDGEGAREEASHPQDTSSIQQSPTEQHKQDPTSHVKTVETEGEAQALTSDSDWLRGKTKRLLDLETADEIAQRQTPAPADTESTSSKDSAEQENEMEEDEEVAEQVSGSLVPNARLFIRNISFDVTETDLETSFGAFGKIQEVHLVVDSRKSSSKGMAYIQFSEPINAEEALRAMDGIAFHGRLLHILPASDKRDNGLTEYELSQMPLKKQKALRRKLEASSASFSWNSLYMNPDAVVSSIANRLGVSKSEIIDPTSADAAVKQAHAETQIIAETKEFLRSRGVQIEAFKNNTRDDRIILLKNFPFGTSEIELKALLEPFGQISRFLLPPAGTMAIAEFTEPYHAAQALKGLAYKNIKGSVLYLEKAPKGILSSGNILPVEKNLSPANDTITPDGIADNLTGQTATVFIRNLSFDTTTTRLAELLSPLAGFKSARVKTRTDSKRPGEILSMGFGFAEFQSAADANAAISAINGYRLDGHELIAKPSTKSTDVAEEQRRIDNAKKNDANKTKIIIKNLPFQTSKKDIRSLFSQYGQLKNVRLPKKFDNTSRGFAFAEFVTAKEAANAMESLANTHLLGRRLVLDFVDEEMIDAEEQIKATERKIEQQSNRINLGKLVSTGRKKFNVGSTEDEVL